MRAIEGEITLMFHLINFYRYRNIKFCASYRDCLLLPLVFSALLITGLEFALFHLLHLTMQLQSVAPFVWLWNFFCGISDLRPFSLVRTDPFFQSNFEKDDKLGSLLAPAIL